MRGRVLVVDDEQALREYMTEFLTEATFVVTACSNGREALEALQRDTFDAVLSDVQMPDMDGLALLRAVREKDLDLPVVLFTGRPSLETALHAIEQGALQYLMKPVAADELLEAAGRAVKLGALARLKRKALMASGFEPLIGDKAGLEVAFTRALRNVWMAYQAIVRAADGSLNAHEALLRTAEPAFPDPGALLAAAERLGRLPDLGRTIRGAVARLMAMGALAHDVFINLHPLDLTDDALLDRDAPLSRFAPRVVLEITERASLENIPDVAGRTHLLRKLGYRIAIDDLGAGYSGLKNFAALTPEIVKLDMSLVRGLDGDFVKQKLVGSMTGLCRELGILVVAEGIETELERDAAVRLGCGFLQGFFLGRPSRMGNV